MGVGKEKDQTRDSITDATNGYKKHKDFIQTLHAHKMKFV